MTSYYRYFSAYPLSDKVLRVGLAVYELMRPECINLSDTDCDAGLELEIFTAVSNMLNLTVEFKYSNQTGCGYQSNGSWTGLLGMLQRNEIDVIGNLCGLDQSRSSLTWLRHSWPVIVYKQNFLIRAPEPKYHFNISGPFHWKVWTALFVTVILFCSTFALKYKTLRGTGFKKSIIQAMIDTLDIVLGAEVSAKTDAQNIKKSWFIFECFIGFMTITYSTVIAVAILKPVTIYRPFRDSKDLVNALYNGEYKILDFNVPPYVKCLDNETLGMLKKALSLHGQQHFQNHRRTNLLLRELHSNPNLVLVKGRFFLRQYLDTFTERHQLWLIDDDTSGEDWSVFFYRKDFAYKRKFNEALIRMGDAKDNLKVLYYGLSYQAIETKTIKGAIPDKITIDLHKLFGLVVNCYGPGLFIASTVFVLELAMRRRC